MGFFSRNFRRLLSLSWLRTQDHKVALALGTGSGENEVVYYLDTALAKSPRFPHFRVFLQRKENITSSTSTFVAIRRFLVTV